MTLIEQHRMALAEISKINHNQARAVGYMAGGVAVVSLVTGNPKTATVAAVTGLCAWSYFKGKAAQAAVFADIL